MRYLNVEYLEVLNNYEFRKEILVEDIVNIIIVVILEQGYRISFLSSEKR